MDNSLIDIIYSDLKLRNRYSLKSVNYGNIPTNYGMRKGLCLIIRHSTYGLRDMELPIYISTQEPKLPVSKSYLESGGIIVDSLTKLDLNILEK